MKRAAAAQASDAADALLDWWNTQALWTAPSGRSFVPADSGFPEEHGTEPVILPTARSDPPTSSDAIERASARRPPESCPPTAIMRLSNPDWLHHRLTISGPPEVLAAFKRAAAGGCHPVALRFGTNGGGFLSPARVVTCVGRSRAAATPVEHRWGPDFARQLREAVGHRHDFAVRAVGHSRACPFDLHALVPVPPAILALGPDEPEALAWLWEHWGTTEAPRHVADDGVAPAAGKAVREAKPDRWHLKFWSADWTPWRALNHLGLQWPALRFDCRPTYEAS